MASCEHLQIVNPSYCRGPDESLDSFSSLPPELRLRIWELALREHRLLEIELEPLREQDSSASSSEEELADSTTNEASEPASGCRYTAIVEGQYLHSNLLRVNSESRSVALRFYRVHLPCYHRRGRKTTLHVEGSKGKTERTLYFNPEYDFMHLKPYETEPQVFVDFIHDFKALDPSGVGLRNLAMNSDAISSLHRLTAIPEAPARESFIDLLSHVEELIWVVESRTGRVILPHTGFEGVGVLFNHSMPVKAFTPFFHLMPRDPRPVGPELKCVLTGGHHPRALSLQWRELLQKWDVRRSQPARERALFAYMPPAHKQIWDVKTASQFLWEEEANWLEGQKTMWYRHLIKMFTGKEGPIESPEQLAKAVRPAIGFWLFSIEAFADLNGDISRSKNVFDISRHWPELALSYLS